MNEINRDSFPEIYYNPFEKYDWTVTPHLFATLLHFEKPFHYVRFGDGEWCSMLNVRPGRRGANCDGHKWMPETLGRQLLDTFMKTAVRDDCFVGCAIDFMPELVQKIVVNYIDKKRIVSNGLFWSPRQEWTWRPFFSKTKNALFISNKKIENLCLKAGWNLLEVKEQNCYLEKDDIVKRAIDTTPENGLILLSCGLPAAVFQYEIMMKREDVTTVDVGHLPQVLIGNHNIRRRYRRRRVKVARRIQSSLLPIIENLKG